MNDSIPPDRDHENRWPPSGRETADENGYFYELQDQCFNEFNESYRTQYHPLSCTVDSDDRPTFTEEPTELQSYHPLYISSKPCLDIGHLSDVHVSARQHLFTQSKAKLIDGKEGEGHRSDEIGGMVNTSYATLKNLMGQMGDDIDLLVFTGDLIDYNRNYNPDNGEDKEKEKKSSEIWKALNLDNLTDKQRYPIGIDNLVMYELFRWYYNEFKKPILLVSGNHEAYTLPYGISPRVKVGRSINATYNFFHRISVDQVIEKSNKLAREDAKKSAKAIEDGKNPDIYDNRANEGIPADHNLTITEAILMYGPDYARVVMSASYINYNTNLPISEKGAVSGTDGHGRHDYGTFEENRATVYPLVKDKIQYALSGHSHRSGLYQITEDKSYTVYTNYGPTETVQYEVQGQATTNKKFQPNGGTRFMVAASGGPIPVQNHDNELFNWGLDIPSGNYIKFSGSAEAEVGIKTATLPQSKPRLAVALDYADIFLRDEDNKETFKHGVFERFESTASKGAFLIKYKDSVKLNAEEVINEAVLVIFQKDGAKIEIQGTAQDIDHTNHQFELKLDTKGFDKLLKIAAQKALMGFIQITLKPGGVDSNVYDTSKHWVFPIEVHFRKEREIEAYQETQMRMISVISASPENAPIADQLIQEMHDTIDKMDKDLKGYIIQRHSLFGEIPDFRLYRDLVPDEYLT